MQKYGSLCALEVMQHVCTASTSETSAERATCEQMFASTHTRVPESAFACILLSFLFFFPFHFTALILLQVTETRTGPLGCSSYDNLDSVSSILLQSPESKLHLQGKQHPHRQPVAPAKYGTGVKH